MIRSMTAFARQERSTEWGTLAWELRSINHRFLELSIRLPEDLRGLEPQTREHVALRLNRGKVECHLRFQPASLAPIELVLNKEFVSRLVQTSREVDRLLYSSAPVNSLDILRWPGALQAVEIDLGPVCEAALLLLDETLDSLAEARAREGARLKVVLEQRCDALSALVTQVRARLPEIRARFRERLASRLAEIKAELDPARLEQEMALLAQKIDVDEEMERLGSHVEEMRRTLNQNEPVGRRLDFLMQELNREANTLGSKSADIETTRASMEMKVLIEQMREQIQNIE
ncbi:MAG: YicC family protein [Gammaproteobacteria bacterium]|nr:YicC family protein [Gammaproteobacteria bacterium]